MVFRKLFKKSDPPAPRHWSVPAGARVYAIGDIHGRLDLLEAVLAKIEEDERARGPATTHMVYLGDLMDRGPDSRGVIERLMAVEAAAPETVFLCGNHEELMIGVWEGNRALTPTFHRAGGRETLMSYGISADEYDGWDFDQVTDATQRAVPQAHIAFLKRFKDWHVIGDYAFVHAGIRPGVHLEDQDAVDLRWIRGEFTKSTQDHGVMVIHGHTIRDDVDEQPNRIGIDTGAYATGKLTAIGLEGNDRWFLQS